jgi:hypothetical protein
MLNTKIEKIDGKFGIKENFIDMHWYWTELLAFQTTDFILSFLFV